MKFSIIIPIYNVEKYLKTCIDSVLTQDFEDYEIILVNDASPDNSGKICDDYAQKHSQVKVIHKENGGVSDARNFGIKEAKGDYILFLDGDDYWKGNNILSDLALIINNENPDLIIHGKTFVFNDGTCREYPMNSSLQSNDFINDYQNLVKRGTYNPAPWNKVIRRSLIIENNIQFPKEIRYHEDVSWNFDIAQQIKTYAIYPNPFYQYRYGRDGSATTIIKDKNTIAYLDICADKTNFLISQEKNNAYFKGNLEYLGLIYLCVFRDYYNTLSQEHQKNAQKHFYKMQNIDNIYKQWFINYLKGRKFKLLIQLFGIQKGMHLIYLYYKYIYKKKLEI